MSAGQAIGLLAALAPRPALAHAPIEGVGGIWGGVLHPVLVPAHALALVGLGLFAAQQAPQVRRWLIAVFSAALVVGLGLIVAAFATAIAAAVVLASAAVAGALAASGRPLPLAVGAPLMAAAGVAIAFDSVPDEISMARTVAILAASAGTAAVVLAVIAAAAGALRRPWQRLGLRILGSWTAATAGLVLALHLAR